MFLHVCLILFSILKLKTNFKKEKKFEWGGGAKALVFGPIKKLIFIGFPKYFLLFEPTIALDMIFI